MAVGSVVVVGGGGPGNRAGFMVSGSSVGTAVGSSQLRPVWDSAWEWGVNLNKDPRRSEPVRGVLIFCDRPLDELFETRRFS